MVIRGTIILAIALALVQGGVALGGGTLSTATIISVQATDMVTGETGQFTQVWPVSNWTGQLAWTLPAATALVDPSTHAEVANLQSLSVNLSADPQADLSFEMTNSSTKTARISIATDTIVFDAGIPNALASASGSLTLNDLGPAGATLTGNFPGNKAYQARYSTDPVMDTATVFANLFSGSTSPGTWSDASPAAGMTNLGTTVYMIESEFNFKLSGKDGASGTSTFLITPEPASAVLLALGGLALLRRRR